MLNYNSTRKKTVDYINKNCGGGTVDTSNLAKLNAENKFQGVGADSDSYIILSPGGAGKSGGSIVISQNTLVSPLTLQKGNDSTIDFFPSDHKINMYKKAYFGDNFYNNFIFPMLAGTVNHNLLTDKTVKTLFGNQSIYTADGTGNIDLYKHHLTVSSYGHDFYGDFYSSKDTQCNSLANLKTILGDTFKLPVYGAVSAGALGSGYYIGLYLDENALSVANTTEVKTISYDAITITDTVTAI